MRRYIITISNADQDGEVDASGPQSVISISTNGGRAQLEEVTMRAGRGGPLRLMKLPTVDYAKLVAAFDQDTGPADAAADDAAPDLAEAESAPGAGTSSTSQARRPVGSPVPRRRASTRRPAASAGVTSTDAGKSLASGRVYRRMPDVRELQEVYARTGTIIGLAAEYDVPRHTAQGWVTRLRRKGLALSSGED